MRELWQTAPADQRLICRVLLEEIVHLCAEPLTGVAPEQGSLHPARSRSQRKRHLFGPTPNSDTHTRRTER